MGELRGWAGYDQWNTAICETMFSPEHRGSPVYMDMDDAIVADVAARLGLAAEDAQTALVAAVRATVDLEAGPAEVFREHLTRLAAWRRQVSSLEPAPSSALPAPPTIALLAAFTLAAEAMGSDRQVVGWAYYPRLADVLGATGDKRAERLRLAYQSAAELLWRSLNDWLVLLDGRCGVPTAFALTHRYIGLPLSQALIRTGDRRQLHQMFARFGLPAGVELSPADMSRVVDTWMEQVPCPASRNLQGLWQRTDARERIAEIAAIELASWDGTTEAMHGASAAGDASGSRSGAVSLLAQLRRFPKLSLALSFEASLPGSSDIDTVTVAGAADTPTLPVMRLAGGLLRPQTLMGIDHRSLLEGVLSLSGPGGEASAKRYPRRVVALRHDEVTNTDVECERVQLGEDFTLLVRQEGSLLASVEDILRAVARPGFTVRTSCAGLPDGWALVTDVQFLAAPAADSPRHPDLNALVPLVASQLGLAGGLRLPGNLRKWSTLAPPEIRAVSQLHPDLSLRITRTDVTSGDDEEQVTATSTDGVLLVDLTDTGLVDGDFEIELSGDGKPLQRTVMRLRSSDTPDHASWDSARALTHDLPRPLAGLAPTPSTPPERPHNSAEAASTTGTTDPSCEQADPVVATGVTQHPRMTPPLGPIWWSSTPPPPLQLAPIVIPAPAPGSCVITGAHHMELPPTPRGRPTAPMFSGHCTQCGLIKRYPAWPRRSPRRNAPAWAAAASAGLEPDEQHQPSGLTPAAPKTITYDDALDALVHLGGGPVSTLKRIAAQLDPSSLAVDNFLRHLEALAHVDLQRDDHQEAAAWHVSPPRLLEAADHTFFLAGGWSSAARAEFENHVINAEGAFSYVEHAQGPTTLFAEDLSAQQLEELLDEVADQQPPGMAVALVRDAAVTALETLPALSEVEMSLPRVPLPGARSIARFDCASAAWCPVATAATPGAYRMESSFRSLYLFRSAADVDAHQAAVCSAQLAKHLEARRAGRPLLAHYPGSQQLAVPLGADLPGRYARAAVLHSGRVPATSRKHRALLYHDVATDFARRLHTLLAT